MGTVRTIRLATANAILTVWVAETATERWQGVRGAACLRPGTGVLITWRNTGRHLLTMRGVSFPLDMIWLDAQLRVTSVLPQVAPETPLVEGYGKAALEMAAGQAAALGLTPGTQ